MKSPVTKLIVALGLVVFGVVIGITGIYISDTDDAPGAGVLGLLLMIGAVAQGLRMALRTRDGRGRPS